MAFWQLILLPSLGDKVSFYWGTFIIFTVRLVEALEVERMTFLALV